MRVFIGKGQCATCHNTSVPARDKKAPDRGRAAAIGGVQRDEFNCLGRFSDAKEGQCDELRFMATDELAMEGAFKTPSPRNVALRPPYMHAG